MSLKKLFLICLNCSKKLFNYKSYLYKEKVFYHSSLHTKLDFILWLVLILPFWYYFIKQPKESKSLLSKKFWKNSKSKIDCKGTNFWFLLLLLTSCIIEKKDFYQKKYKIQLKDQNEFYEYYYYNNLQINFFK